MGRRPVVAMSMLARSNGRFAVGLLPVGISVAIGLDDGAACIGVPGTVVAANSAPKSPDDPAVGPAIALGVGIVFTTVPTKTGKSRSLGKDQVIRGRKTSSATIHRWNTRGGDCDDTTVPFSETTILEPRCNSAELDPTTQHADAMNRTIAAAK